MDRRAFYEYLETLKHPVFRIRLRCASERLVSLFTKQVLEAVAVGYKVPKLSRKRVLALNALGVRVIGLEDVTLESLMACPYLERVEVFDVDLPTAQSFLRKAQKTPAPTPEVWARAFMRREWENGSFYEMAELLDGREPLKIRHYAIRDNTIPLEADEAFMGRVWPYIYQFLLKDEFRLALPLSDPTDPLYQLSIALEKGTLDVGGWNVPGLRVPENRCVVFRTEPCKDVGTIHDTLGSFLESVHRDVKADEPVSVPWAELVEIYNELSLCLGKGCKAQIFHAPVEGLLEFRPSETIGVRLEEGLVKRISVHTKDFSGWAQSELRELLLQIDARSSVEKPLESLRCAITKAVAEME